MRVIAGSLRGRRIAAPPGLGTRPMLDRVREAIFSTLAPWLDGAAVLDLFAGSGAMSIEALSRGAAHAVLVERDPKVRAVCAANLAELGIEERAELRGGDALSASERAGGPFDVVFVDAPFPMVTDAKLRPLVLDAVRAVTAESLADEGVLVLHVPVGVLRERDLEGLESRERVYGGQAIWYVQRGE
ncbi:MAG: 16S rRNA (guanine(966)-N(2))-methyltransferase RsmD [Planctomycetota bacterium]